MIDRVATVCDWRAHSGARFLFGDCLIETLVGTRPAFGMRNEGQAGIGLKVWIQSSVVHDRIPGVFDVCKRV